MLMSNAVSQFRFRIVTLASVSLLVLGGRPAAASPITLTNTTTLNSAFALSQMFGVTTGGNGQPSGHGEANHGVAQAGFSVGTNANGDSVSAFVIDDVPASPNTQLLQSTVEYQLDTAQSNVDLLGISITDEDFTLQGLSTPTLGEIVVNFSRLFAPPHTDTASVQWTLLGQVTLFQNGVQIAFANTQVGAGQLVFDGLLQPGADISLSLLALAEVQTIGTGTLIGNANASVDFESWSVSASTASDTATPVPEPTSLLLLGTGLVGACRWRKQHNRA
jgi:hypothetical protein